MAYCFLQQNQCTLFSTKHAVPYIFSGRVGGKILKSIKRRNAIYNTAYIFLYLGSKYYYSLFLVIVHSALSATRHSMQPYRFIIIALYAIILQGNQDSSKDIAFPFLRF